MTPDGEKLIYDFKPILKKLGIDSAVVTRTFFFQPTSWINKPCILYGAKNISLGWEQSGFEHFNLNKILSRNPCFADNKELTVHEQDEIIKVLLKLSRSTVMNNGRVPDAQVQKL